MIPSDLRSFQVKMQDLIEATVLAAVALAPPAERLAAFC
jgi:hypothetical protein